MANFTEIENRFKYQSSENVIAAYEEQDLEWKSIMKLALRYSKENAFTYLLNKFQSRDRPRYWLGFDLLQEIVSQPYSIRMRSVA